MTPASAACSECRTLLGGYVLGAIEPDEADAVRRHLAECAECAIEHDELAGVPVLLDMAGDDEVAREPPPAALEEAVLDRFAREHPAHHSDEPRMPFWGWLEAARRRLTRPLPAALAGAAAAAAVTAAVLVLPGRAPHTAAGEAYQARLVGLASAPNATASASLVTFDAGTRMRLHVRGLRSSPAAIYQLWCLRDDGVKVSAGTFRVDAGGRADVNLTSAAVPGEYHRLSVERSSAASASRAGQPVLAGDIQYGHS